MNTFFSKKSLATPGVRMYTLDMPDVITSTGAQVVVDWSNLFQIDQAPTNKEEIAYLLDWVRSYPRKSAIHVYLHTSQKHQESRQLQSTLQALGCRVTATRARSTIL